MKRLNDWLLSKNINENVIVALDGEPLKPRTISGAERQIRQLALEIRTTFGLDERFKNHPGIQACSKLLEQAASVLDDGSLSGEERNAPHRFHH